MNSQMLVLGNRQQGAATLMVSMVLLIAITLVVFVTARSAIMEQRISANELRTTAALEAAQAGMDAAMAYMRSPGGMYKNSPNVGDPADFFSFPAIELEGDPGRVTGHYQFIYCERNTDPADLECPDLNSTLANACTSPIRGSDTAREALILSCGWSDDGIARASVIQQAMNTPSMANPPTNPMTARGAVTASGAVNVSNYFNNLTIWTGENVDSIGAVGNTAIRDPSIPPPGPTEAPREPLPQGASCATGYVCTTYSQGQVTNIGPDVIDADPSISERTAEEFFINYFGMPFDDYRDTMPSQYLGDSPTSGELSDVHGEVVWLDGNGGDVQIPSGTTIGSRDEPVILIVDGNMRFQGNTTIYGVVYVTGDMVGAGTPTIYGSTVVQGDVATDGTVNIVYDPVSAGGAGRDTGPSGSLAGTWRDWL